MATPKGPSSIPPTPGCGFVFKNSAFSYELNGAPDSVSAKHVQASRMPSSREECYEMWSEATAQGSREMFRPTLARFVGSKPAMRAIEQVSIEAAEFDGVPTQILRPKKTELETKNTLPALIYLHGGGGFMGSAEMWNHCCARLASEAGIVVVNVDYRLAPEHPFPAGVEDVQKVVRAVVADAARLGIDGNKLALGGDSAGGHHAVAVARRIAKEDGDAKTTIKLLLAMSPMETKWARDVPFDELVGTERDGAGLMRLCDRSMSGEDEAYLRALITSGELHPMLLTASEASDELPPTLVVTSEFDLLRRPSEEFARVLAEGGQLADLIVYPGTPHVFWLNMEHPLAASVYRDTASVLRRLLVDGCA